MFVIKIIIFYKTYVPQKLKTKQIKNIENSEHILLTVTKRRKFRKKYKIKVEIIHSILTKMSYFGENYTIKTKQNHAESSENEFKSANTKNIYFYSKKQNFKRIQNYFTYCENYFKVLQDSKLIYFSTPQLTILNFNIFAFKFQQNFFQKNNFSADRNPIQIGFLIKAFKLICLKQFHKSFDVSSLQYILSFDTKSKLLWFFLNTQICLAKKHGKYYLFSQRCLFCLGTAEE